jgi:hypothetical protein
MEKLLKPSLTHTTSLLGNNFKQCASANSPDEAVQLKNRQNGSFG